MIDHRNVIFPLNPADRPSIQDIHCQFIIVISNHTNRRFPISHVIVVLSLLIFPPGPRTRFQPPHQSTVSLWLHLIVTNQFSMEYFYQIFSLLIHGRWTRMDESVIISQSSILCSYHFFSYQTFLYNNEPDCRRKIRVGR